MQGNAMGFIETFGYGTAVMAVDAALKAAAVEILRIENTIGSGGSLGVTVFLRGEVAAVRAALDAGKQAAEEVGRVVAGNVIPNLDDKVRKGMYHNKI